MVEKSKEKQEIPEKQEKTPEKQENSADANLEKINIESFSHIVYQII